MRFDSNKEIRIVREMILMDFLLVKGLYRDYIEIIKKLRERESLLLINIRNKNLLFLYRVFLNKCEKF